MKKKPTKILRSRIIQYFPKDLLNEIEKIVNNRRISDTNVKTDLIHKSLDKYDIDYNELGTGTNRTAVFIDGYVFKIALDKWGKRDNDQEFVLSHELQPYVIKVYENNSLISVSEYVVVMTKEEFIEKKNDIRKILKDISSEYLLGDIGTIAKNFANFGYRDNGEIVALDYAYIYRVIGDELICTACDFGAMLEYTPDFDKLFCPHCRKQYDFMEVRASISKEFEMEDLQQSMDKSFKLTEHVEEVDDLSDMSDEDIKDTHKYHSFKFTVSDAIYYNDHIKENEKGDVENMGKKYEEHVDDADMMLDEMMALMEKKNQRLHNVQDDTKSVSNNIKETQVHQVKDTTTIQQAPSPKHENVNNIQSIYKKKSILRAYRKRNKSEHVCECHSNIGQPNNVTCNFMVDPDICDIELTPSTDDQVNELNKIKGALYDYLTKTFGVSIDESDLLIEASFVHKPKNSTNDNDRIDNTIILKEEDAKPDNDEVSDDFKNTLAKIFSDSEEPQSINDDNDKTQASSDNIDEEFEDQLAEELQCNGSSDENTLTEEELKGLYGLE